VRAGRYKLRCSVYFKNVLLQSYVVWATADRELDFIEKANSSELDYSLSQNLDLRVFAEVPPQRLSILLNDDGKGTHGFRFVGDQEWVADAHLSDDQLGALIDYVRGGLRQVAWNSRRSWEASFCYRYEAPPAGAFEADLVLLAKHGYRLYAETMQALRVPGAKARSLAGIMLAPGDVQIALKRGASHLFPASLVYDYPLDSSSSKLSICPDFASARAAGRSLEREPCFRGECPHRDDLLVVCPSGFWGFRHRIGVPLSLDSGDVATQIRAPAGTAMLVAISTDPDFKRRDSHVASIRALARTTTVENDRAAVLSALRRTLHLAYFYCHGGLTDAGVPYLEVGARKSDPIVSDNLLAFGIHWDDPRPLVVLNGCHTTATKPEQLMDLVSGFVNHARAAGVVGTEITIFEPLAVAFGERFLSEVLAGKSIGEAVRVARLALLASGNPLGLVYIPFALPSLSIS
jgi:hypothetical protein